MHFLYMGSSIFLMFKSFESPVDCLLLSFAHFCITWLQGLLRIPKNSLYKKTSALTMTWVANILVTLYLGSMSSVPDETNETAILLPPNHEIQWPFLLPFFPVFEAADPSFLNSSLFLHHDFILDHLPTPVIVTSFTPSEIPVKTALERKSLNSAPGVS